MSQEKPKVMLSQFPCETILFCKDFFMDIAKRSTEDGSSKYRTLLRDLAVSLKHLETTYSLSVTPCRIISVYGIN